MRLGYVALTCLSIIEHARGVKVDGGVRSDGEETLLQPSGAQALAQRVLVRREAAVAASGRVDLELEATDNVRSAAATVEADGSAIVVEAGRQSRNGTASIDHLKQEDTGEQELAPTVPDGASSALAQTRSVEQVAVASWVSVLVLDKSFVHATPLNSISNAIQAALAESLEICHSAIRVRDVHPRGDTSVVQVQESRRKANVRRPSSTSLAGRLSNSLMGHFSWLAHVAFQRRVDALLELAVNSKEAQSITEVRIDYEVRVLKELEATDKEIMARVSYLEGYNMFTRFNDDFATALSREDSKLVHKVMLEDVGPASREIVDEEDLSQSKSSACTEEGLLRNARRTHQTVLLLSIALVLLIVCTGSVVFTVKQPSLIPSRLNPLIGPPPR